MPSLPTHSLFEHSHAPAGVGAAIHPLDLGSAALVGGLLISCGRRPAGVASGRRRAAGRAAAPGAAAAAACPGWSSSSSSRRVQKLGPLGLATPSGQQMLQLGGCLSGRHEVAARLARRRAGGGGGARGSRCCACAGGSGSWRDGYCAGAAAGCYCLCRLLAAVKQASDEEAGCLAVRPAANASRPSLAALSTCSPAGSHQVNDNHCTAAHCSGM